MVQSASVEEGMTRLQQPVPIETIIPSQIAPESPKPTPLPPPVIPETEHSAHSPVSESSSGYMSTSISTATLSDVYTLSWDLPPLSKTDEDETTPTAKQDREFLLEDKWLTEKLEKEINLGESTSRQSVKFEDSQQNEGESKQNAKLVENKTCKTELSEIDLSNQEDIGATKPNGTQGSIVEPLADLPVQPTHTVLSKVKDKKSTKPLENDATAQESDSEMTKLARGFKEIEMNGQSLNKDFGESSANVLDSVLESTLALADDREVSSNQEEKLTKNKLFFSQEDAMKLAQESQGRPQDNKMEPKVSESSTQNEDYGLLAPPGDEDGTTTPLQNEQEDIVEFSVGKPSNVQISKDNGQSSKVSESSKQSKNDAPLAPPTDGKATLYQNEAPQEDIVEFRVGEPSNVQISKDNGQSSKVLESFPDSKQSKNHASLAPPTDEKAPPQQNEAPQEEFCIGEPSQVQISKDNKQSSEVLESLVPVSKPSKDSPLLDSSKDEIVTAKPLQNDENIVELNVGEPSQVQSSKDNGEPSKVSKSPTKIKKDAPLAPPTDEKATAKSTQNDAPQEESTASEPSQVQISKDNGKSSKVSKQSKKYAPLAPPTDEKATPLQNDAPQVESIISEPSQVQISKDLGQSSILKSKESETSASQESLPKVTVEKPSDSSKNKPSSKPATLAVSPFKIQKVKSSDLKSFHQMMGEEEQAEGPVDRSVSPVVHLSVPGDPPEILSDAEGGDAPACTVLPDWLREGEFVTVGASKHGTVRYLGPTDFAEGLWVGVELEVPAGKNDGSVGGKHYFHCNPGYGVLVRPDRVSRASGSTKRRRTNKRRSANLSGSSPNLAALTALAKGEGGTGLGKGEGGTGLGKGEAGTGLGKGEAGTGLGKGEPSTRGRGDNRKSWNT